ncbi:SIMPL domain-containing protein [Chitinophaga qingshengii]|uniref:SIMPL domain-containing protein n=1 Tax=Chitinophaga qingshengii TaxID=1569794 RepID=A0ABR7TLD6_9BACT|nr:SIMPL domain-containing protein [Chitinophaga qingshengii]MBC9931306.1 SIMPL domain-containing protein [Chitinophaga qingshengii]
MKKVMLLAAGLFFALSTFAQQADNKQVKKIEVNGSAEIEITPDEINLDISLKEYIKGKNKVDITTLEKQLVKAIADAGLPKESLTIENISSSNYEILRKKKDPNEFMARKQYRLKLNKLDKINDILGAVDAEGIESTRIASFTSSKMEQYRQEVKIKAMKAAKAKAEYMLAAIGNSIDNIIEVQEINTDNYTDVRPQFANVAMYKSADAMGGGAPEIDFKTIKIRAEVRTVFGIK